MLLSSSCCTIAVIKWSPVSESRYLCSALAGHAGVHYTEMLFQHLDPVKGKLPLFRLLWELGKFFLAVYPMFRQAVAS